MSSDEEEIWSSATAPSIRDVIGMIERDELGITMTYEMLPDGTVVIRYFTLSPREPGTGVPGVSMVAKK